METTVPPKSLMPTCMPDLFVSVKRCASRPSLVFPNTLFFTPGVCAARPSLIVNTINSNTQIPILICSLLNVHLHRRSHLHSKSALNVVRHYKVLFHVYKKNPLFKQDRESVRSVQAKKHIPRCRSIRTTLPQQKPTQKNAWRKRHSR